MGSGAGLRLKGALISGSYRDPDEAYELYDDVEPTDNSSPSPMGRGLLVVGLSPEPEHPAQAPGDHSLQGHIVPCCCSKSEGQSVSLAVPGEKVEGRKGLLERPCQLLTQQ